MGPSAKTVGVPRREQTASKEMLSRWKDGGFAAAPLRRITAHEDDQRRRKREGVHMRCSARSLNSFNNIPRLALQESDLWTRSFLLSAYSTTENYISTKRLTSATHTPRLIAPSAPQHGRCQSPCTGTSKIEAQCRSRRVVRSS